MRGEGCRIRDKGRGRGGKQQRRAKRERKREERRRERERRATCPINKAVPSAGWKEQNAHTIKHHQPQVRGGKM